MHHTQAPRGQNQSGFTIAELVVSIAVVGILSVTMVAFVTTWLQHYSISTVRNTLNADSQTVLRRLSDDIRKSSKLLTENATPDTNAPLVAGKWVSSSTVLILAQTPYNSSGQALYTNATTFTGTPNSIVYYLKNNVLYRRIIPATYTGNVALPLISCSPTTAEGGCGTDIQIGQNVHSIAYSYYTATGTVTSDVTLARSVKINVELRQSQAGQTISSTSTATMSFRTQ